MKHNLKHAYVDERSTNVVRWFLDADDNPDSHQSLISSSSAIYIVPWNLHANSFRCVYIQSTN